MSLDRMGRLLKLLIMNVPDTTPEVKLTSHPGKSSAEHRTNQICPTNVDE